MQGRNSANYKLFRLFIVEVTSDRLEDSIMYSLLCKIIRAALMISYGIRRDASLCISINSLKTSLLCQGNLIRGLHVDEPSCAGFLKKFFARSVGMGFKLVDSCLNYAHSLDLHELNLESLLFNSIDGLREATKIYKNGIYIRFVSDGYGNTRIGLKIWNLLSIVNITLDSVQ
ncbi:MAG: hypothetical protein N3D82_05325 [Ignisphaera sp.]|nr:hypothetical protein [Ignisphaera sp.]MCX8168428.1 hypothetical protein [Ignisphaera sp.]MDW8086059.1 hypothetical protein [Ignisphaera sp.]